MYRPGQGGMSAELLAQFDEHQGPYNGIRF